MRQSETAKRWLIWLGCAGMLVAARVGCVLYNRSQPFPQKKIIQRRLEKDYLVTVPKFYMDDFQSAQKLVGKTLWVKLGYSTEYFPEAESQKRERRVDIRRFEPMEKITVEKVVERPGLLHSRDKEIWLMFRKEGMSFGTVAGFFYSKESRYIMQLDDLFYLSDPRAIYTHWGQNIWQKIERHEVEEQMTLAQVVLSLGYGGLVTTGAGGSQLYQFDRKPGGEVGETRVRFVDGRVKEFETLK